ncbi:antirepressor [Xenorhabdus stockiae]|uniref:Antirepressor n=1 Tax=Xenorhabdus stockiae TaxID=351614 RepID=A0A2D0KKL6_9GAMM|nr:ORF6N domain-containing protein [Xenorhabdus stockiae]PHM63942.1 antirepressor [Xenorhabdus stockiae]
MVSITVNELTKNSPSVEHMIPIMYNSVPVITTELLADVYETDVIRIQQNHARNTDRFVEGTHFFKLTGSILREFKNRLSLSESVKELSLLVGKRARSLILWTERGAARHAKMLDTDKAWDVFGKLEDFYFNLKGVETKTTTHDRTPLRGLVNTLMGKYGISDRTLFQMVHREFGVKSIGELTSEQLPSAIEYLATKAIEGELLPKEELPALNLNELAYSMSFFDGYDDIFKAKGINKDGALKNATSYPVQLLNGAEYPNPINSLLNGLSSMGINVEAARFQLQALAYHLEIYHRKVAQIKRDLEYI